MAGGIRVLVVDDTVMYRKVLSDVLQGMPGVEVVGAVSNGKMALSSMARLKPDIMTLDFEMPVMDGLATLQELKKIKHDTAVVMVSAHTRDGATITMQALELGAFDFIAKPDGVSLEENRHLLIRQLRPVIQSVVTRKILAKTKATLNHNRVATPRTEVSHVARSAPLPRGVVASVRSPVISTPAEQGGHAARPEIVAIGVSTGGPNALAEIIPRLPATLRVPIIIVQHMPPVFTAALADSLNLKSELTVQEGRDGDVLKAGYVYIAPGGRHLGLRKKAMGAQVRLSDDPPENHCRPSVDYMMRSVAEVYGNKTVGVILTGMGADGVKGLQVMKQRGSVVIAQDKESCVVYGMPMEAVKAGVTDVELPLTQIAAEIIRRVH